MFRPRGFSPPRRLTPHTGLGSIAPRNRMKFATLPGFSPDNDQPKPICTGRIPPIPAARFTPSEEFPSSIAVPHHCGLCLSCCSVASRPRPHRSENSTLLCVPTGRRLLLTSLAAEAAQVRLLPPSVPLIAATLEPKPSSASVRFSQLIG
jgi:hypothetical protein